jgi:hypothetical protein
MVRAASGRPGDDEAALDRDQQPAPVKGVGQYAADDAEHDVWSMSAVWTSETGMAAWAAWAAWIAAIGRRRLHPGADVARRAGQPQPSEDRDQKRSPRRRS